jgi:hypothetical protein
MVETETEDAEADLILLGCPALSGSSLCLSLFRPLSRSASALASCSSATPFLKAQVR